MEVSVRWYSLDEVDSRLDDLAVYLLLTTQCLVLTTHYSLLTARYSLLATHRSLLTAHYSLLTTHYALLTSKISQSCIPQLRFWPVSVRHSCAPG